MTEYTPTTEEIVRYFDALHYKIDPQRDGEDFASYLGRISVETMHHRIASEDAARRWLAEHDRQVAEKALLEYADALEENNHAAVWDHKDFVFDVRNWASERLSARKGRWMSDEELAEHDLHVAAAAWDEGWDAGNEYAIAEPWDSRMHRSKNPYRVTLSNVASKVGE